jgi:pyruvate-ferredoxin/flavodoxin oxidoreductase
MNETRYSQLTRQFPERAEELFARAEKDAKKRYDELVGLEAFYAVK